MPILQLEALVTIILYLLICINACLYIFLDSKTTTGCTTYVKIRFARQLSNDWNHFCWAPHCNKQRELQHNSSLHMHGRQGSQWNHFCSDFYICVFFYAKKMYLSCGIPYIFIDSILVHATTGLLQGQGSDGEVVQILRLMYICLIVT